MSAIIVSLPFTRMARKEKQVSTEQLNVRVPSGLIDWMDAYRESQPFRLTYTQVVEAALTDWLGRHAESHRPKKAK